MLTPDSAAHNLINILENGKTSYKLITTEKDLAIESEFKILDDNNFELSFTLQPDEQKRGIDIDYFFQKPFVLATHGMRVFVKNSSVRNASRGLNEDSPCKFKVELQSFKGDADENMWKQSRQKAYIKYKISKFNPYSSGLTFDLRTHEKDNGFFNAVALKIRNIDFLFYHEAVDTENGYFIINPNGKIDFTQLEAIVEAVITAYGFLNGFYMRDAIYYFTVKEIDNKSKVSFYYENFNTSILSDKPILDSGNYADIPRQERELTSAQFNKLVNLLYDDKEFSRSAYLLIEAGTLKGCSQASLGAVALETITKKIQEKNVPQNIVDDKKTWNGLRYELMKIVKKYTEHLTKDQLTILTNKISLINNKPNSSKLTSPFEQLGIKLNAEEKECINSRNLFLHGNLPRNKNSALSDQELLNILANRLVMLSSMLLLKLIGYEGKVIDRGMTEVIKWRMIHAGQKVYGGNLLRNINRPADE
ncbi:hypothetical protein [Pedobacter sp. MW01-1-1]|uniref:hypothetical protein n=1 Tax=Pedobacter sp. MW01-1-1 TaxID=3383027 RepID=UPI003FF0D5E9